MRLKIFENNNYFICKLLSDEIKKEDLNSLKSLVKKNSGKNFAFDFSQIKKIHHSFFELLSEFQISLFSINSNILAYFSICNNLNLTSIYLNKEDFFLQKRALAKRNFKLIK